MSQAKVTEFFSTRKRNRFNQDEVLLNKQRKSQVLADTSPVKLDAEKLDRLQQLKNKIIANHERTLRSRTSANAANNGNCGNKKEEVAEPVPPAKQLKQPKRSPVKRTTKAQQQQQAEKEKEEKEVGAAESEEVKEKVSAPEEGPPPVKQLKATRKKVNMAELKQKIQQFNQNLLAFQSEEKSSESSSSSLKPADKEEAVNKVDVSSKTAKLPAYLKFQELAAVDIDHTSTLTLPKTYSLLLDAFKGSDTIIKFLFNRNEVCTFLKLRMSIPNITKHTFELKHLGQIRHVYEEAYVYKQEKLFIDFKNDFHLIIAPNMDEIELNPETNRKEFSPCVLLKRLNQFKANLFNIVKKFHQKFLESIGIEGVPFDNIKRWHQKFDLDSLGEIEEAELPKPPVDDSIKCKTGQELLNIAKEIKSARLEKAIKEGLIAEADVKKSDSMTKKETTDGSSEKKDTKYNALLERIRSKEKQKAVETMVLNSDKEKTLAKYVQIKDMIRFLMFFFDAEKKTTLELDKCCLKMKENSKAGLGELECRDMLLVNMAGDDPVANVFRDESGKKWLNIIKVRNVSYLKMDKSFQLNFLNNLCDQHTEKIKSSS